MSLSPDRTDPPTPPSNPEFWAEQTLALAEDLNAVSAAFADLAARLPRAIQQAADLGLMREQHDTAGLRMALRGDIDMNTERDERQAGDHAALVALRGEIAMLRGEVAALAARVDKVTE